MPGDPRYAQEKLEIALRELVCSEAGLRDRLYNVLIGPLVALGPDDFPDQELSEMYRRFHDEVSRVEATGEEGDFKATILRMDMDEVKRHLVTVVGLYEGVMRATGGDPWKARSA